MNLTNHDRKGTAPPVCRARRGPIWRISIFFLLLLLTVCLALPGPLFADGDLPTKSTNKGSIANTRHNLTQRNIGAGYINMNPYRNDYNEVCVYCHTPHGANSTLGAPLWNRTHLGNTYSTYGDLGTSTLSSTVSQPGVNSLTCLSCHDGTLAVDSIINMPGSGRYNTAQESSQNNTFLDSWNNAAGPDASVHLGLTSAENGADEDTGCLVCHSTDANEFVGAGATNFKSFAIGTDLTNDHPVGIAYPENRAIGNDPDFNSLPDNGSGGRFSWYDEPVSGGSQAGDSDKRMDKGEIRFYDNKVECASCHDPHGVPNPDNDDVFYPTFLRTGNSGSKLCQTCHAK